MITLILRYLRLPLIMTIPYLIFVILVELIFRLIRYNFFTSNENYNLLFNEYSRNIFKDLLENIAKNFYNSIEGLIPSGISSKYIDLVNTISSNLLFNIGLFYILYCSIAVILMSIVFKYGNSFLKKFKITEELIILMNQKLNDTNGDYFRNFAHEKLLGKLSMEIKLLLTNHMSYQVFQFSVFLSISLIVVPYFTHEYVFLIGKYFNLLFLFDSIESYLNSFRIYIILQFIGLSIFMALCLVLIFSKKNLFVMLMKNIIVNNLLSLYKLDMNDERLKKIVISRVSEFNDNNGIGNLFYFKLNETV
ncbi:hypothetical protein L5F07_06620 [Aliarcobacter butzleri]|uniref:hypothetical protein n=1 Tax=Aliarcobacter butzleri TaxID=28197 RepID=UPI001EDC6C88|nr:hypothetical protein [Aliarcobacter butzleri]MCG3678924.1 hypothetical protein [Aliarcobacter butzleri]MDY0193982.1 hypothetical protein [Aliarcobacter butzleri]